MPDADGAPFWRYAAQGELRVQACADCGEPRFPPAPAARTAGPSRPSGVRPPAGRIWSYVVPHPPLLPEYAAQASYNVILVELAEAPRIRMVGNLVTEAGAPLDSLSPDRVRIGARVQALFDAAGLPQRILERP